MENEYRDWSQLVPEILDLIASRLSLADYYRFGSVCTTWRHSRSSYRHPIPWLLYSRFRTSKSRGFYCLQNKRFYQIPMPEAFRQGWWSGSSHGWLIMFNQKNYSDSLFNPFTGNTIPLPNNHHNLNHGDLFNFSVWKKRFTSCIKAILSSEPTLANIAAGRCVVAAIVIRDEVSAAAWWDDGDNHDDHLLARWDDDGNHDYHLLVFCRPGDENWTPCVIPNDFDLEIANIIFSDGKLYGITRFLHLYVFDINDKAISWRKLLTHPPSTITSKEKAFHNPLYMVESRGELLLIIRVMSLQLRPGPSRRYTKSFSIFKLDSRTDPASWVRVEDIHGRVLFVGRDQPQLIELSGFHEWSGFESNCIYYVDDDYDDAENSSPEIGVFRLDGRLRLLPRGISIIPFFGYPCLFPSIWFTPNP
ncbi:hypothetical protein HS088_TW21G01351 [Tripterygium wilfordii]|uniref:DUF295 domain-containing protein n=1 Tax=Tripterygium wilfordii TaxID=458696 RepID=A0A7J7C500_TRIWF|nr:F-box/kelch-repeat protein At1g57790-like [Tripterygium wilfordii]KAF5729192.1 hypothetical protein HS088_TW21G01351 [Tripterygium wilfordii]